MTLPNIENFRTRTRTDGIIEAAWSEDANPKRRTTGTRCADSAKVIIKQIEAEVKSVRFPENPTIEEICDRHLDMVRLEKPEANLAPLEGSLNSIKRRLGSLRTDQITQSIVDNA